MRGVMYRGDVCPLLVNKKHLLGQTMIFNETTIGRKLVEHNSKSKSNFSRSAYLLVLLIAVAIASGAVRSEERPLPHRKGPPPFTSSNVPHVQIGVEPVPEVDAELLRRVSALPKVDIRPTIVSLPGAKGLWLLDDIPLVRPEVIVRGREFAHIHPDGSLHASLPPQRAQEAVDAGWAVWHPWAKKREGWEGFVMLYTPQSMYELEVTFQLIVDGYNYVTGKNVVAKDYGKEA